MPDNKFHIPRADIVRVGAQLVHRLKSTALLALALLAMTPMAARPADPAKRIRAALLAWTAAFNSRHAAAVCGLFSPDLRYDYRGLPPQNYRDICDRLKRTLADPAVHRRYAPEIREILVSGDLAVVRLVWHLTTRRYGRPETQTAEFGLDIFRREPDGGWRIVRFLAYEAPPER